MKKNIVLFSSLIIILWLISLGFYYALFLKKEEKVIFWENIIKTSSFVNEVNTSSWVSIEDFEKSFNEQFKNEIENITSLTTAICSTYENYASAVKSRYFWMIKNDINTILKNIENDSFNFLYIILPKIVYNACEFKEKDFNEKILTYMQSKEENIQININSNLKEELNTYVDQIVFKERGNIAVEKLRNDKTYFDNYFFNTNDEEIVALYYPYYIKEWKNISNFLSKPANSLDEEVEFKNKIMTALLLNLKTIGIEDITDFRNLIQKHYSISNLEEYKNSIFNDYWAVIKMSDENWFELIKKLSEINNYKEYILSWEYTKIFKNEELKKKINELWKKMTILTILSNDYADGINETWSWKQFLWDDMNGNNIIRLHYIYILHFNSSF